MRRKVSSSSSHCSSHSSVKKTYQTECCYQATECGISVCALCICCPLTILWCCVKFPCKVAWQIGKRLMDSNCCRSDSMRVISASTSFSDTGSDDYSRTKVGRRIQVPERQKAYH
ncbi:hypothetical protein IFM89_027135 [Coptis chinensis]|uniref:Uncharacterized protein n=1 Tax=Coptis chinensis TaxID=261450 RepID=A0A835IYL7_9MAGN|nr:hypothetical protein IFM89_027135 [Coptis chinensis]